MIRWLIRLVTTPALIILRTLEWCVMYIVQYSGMLCRLIAGMIFFLAITGFTTGLGRGEDVLELLVVGFCVFLIPQLGGIVFNCIVLVRSALRNLLK